MAKYSIKEIFDFCKAHDGAGNLLFARLLDPPEDPEEVDVRPQYIKDYVDNNYTTARGLDKVIERDFGSWLYCRDCEDVASAFASFAQDNYVYYLLHRTELGMVYKAFTSDFNPIENYDRHEDTTVSTDMSTGGISKTAPDDSETFYNVGSADSTTEGDVTTTGHIHGNIGVTEAVTMIDHTAQFFINNSMYDYLVKKLIYDSCYMLG